MTNRVLKYLKNCLGDIRSGFPFNEDGPNKKVMLQAKKEIMQKALPMQVRKYFK